MLLLSILPVCMSDPSEPLPELELGMSPEALSASLSSVASIVKDLERRLMETVDSLSPQADFATWDRWTNMESDDLLLSFMDGPRNSEFAWQVLQQVINLDVLGRIWEALRTDRKAGYIERLTNLLREVAFLEQVNQIVVERDREGLLLYASERIYMLADNKAPSEVYENEEKEKIGRRVKQWHNLLDSIHPKLSKIEIIHRTGNDKEMTAKAWEEI